MRPLRLALLVVALSCFTLAMGVASAAPPRPIDPVPPQYPRWALGTGVRTDVELRALIGSDGKVRQVEIVPYDVRNDFLTRDMRASFDTAAVRAVRGWRFSPATREGRPVTVWWTLRVPFADPEDSGGLGADSSTTWSDTVAAPGEVSVFPEPIHRETPEWPAAAPYVCSGVIVVKVGLDRGGRVRRTRVAQDLLHGDSLMVIAVKSAVLRAARQWRYAPAEVEGASGEMAVAIAFRVPAPHTGADVIVGCVRDSLTRAPRPWAEIFGRGDSHAFGMADETGWFVLRGRATLAGELRAVRICRAGGYRRLRLWKQPGDELTLFVWQGRCPDETR